MSEKNGGEPTELEILQAKLNKEMEKWDQLRVDLGQVPVGGGTLRLSLRLDTITKLLIEKEIITPEEADKLYCELALDFYPKLREQMEPQIIAARTEALKRGHLT
jgi:hypothetical protein